MWLLKTHPAVRKRCWSVWEAKTVKVWNSWVQCGDAQMPHVFNKMEKWSWMRSEPDGPPRKLYFRFLLWRLEFAHGFQISSTGLGRVWVEDVSLPSSRLLQKSEDGASSKLVLKEGPGPTRPDLQQTLKQIKLFYYSTEVWSVCPGVLSRCKWLDCGWKWINRVWLVLSVWSEREKNIQDRSGISNVLYSLDNREPTQNCGFEEKYSTRK